MTSTDAVKKEIARFLVSSDAEVLCITGEWGVGKTYTWQTILDRLRSTRSVALSRYSYVSLFGIGSFEALKLSIFENLEFLLPQGRNGFEWMLSGGNMVLKNSKKFVGMAAALPKVGDAISRAQPLLFSSIRNQILCIDDLERRGGISVKDVFGLISYLREQRGCKIVLLLNQTKLDEIAESKKEFASYFEKVIDTKLVFAPTASEAVEIAFDGKDALSVLMAEHAEKLGVSNIRVLKEIERMIRMVVPIVTPLDPAILRQAVHSVTIFGWCKFDAGANPPPLEYLKTGSVERYLDRKGRNEEPSEQERRWDTVTAEYQFSHLDDFDLALLRFVETSVLDEDEILKFAKKNEEQFLRNQRAGSYDSAWRSYHDSFAEDEDKVCESLVDGTKANLDIVSRANFDATLSVLRDLGRTEMADELIEFAEKEGSADFWTSDDPFGRKFRDAKLNEIVAARREAAKPVLNFEADLIAAAESMNGEKLAQLAQVPEADYVALFEKRTGDQLRKVILSALDYRKFGNPSDDMSAIVKKAEDALRIIGGKSKLNALRVQKYGVSV